jgi:activator of HSP90 ATPase
MKITKVCCQGCGADLEVDESNLHAERFRRNAKHSSVESNENGGFQRI